jgi:hypothetical protein
VKHNLTIGAGIAAFIAIFSFGVAQAENSVQRQAIREYSDAIVDIASQAYKSSKRIDQAIKVLAEYSDAIDSSAKNEDQRDRQNLIVAAKNEWRSAQLARDNFSLYNNTIGIWVTCIGLLGGSLSPEVESAIKETGSIGFSAIQKYVDLSRDYERRSATWR